MTRLAGVTLLALALTTAPARADDTERRTIVEYLERLGLAESDTEQAIPRTTDDAFRLALVDSLLDRPLLAPAACEALAAMADDPAAAPSRFGGRAAQLLAGVPTREPEPTGASAGASGEVGVRVAAALREAGVSDAVAVLIADLADAAAARAGAHRVDRALLEEALHQLEEDEDEGERDPFALRHAERRAMRRADAFFAEAAALDVGADVSRALPILDAVGRVAAALRDSTHEIHRTTWRPLRVPTPAGDVRVAGDGADLHEGDALLLLDPGGNDRYPRGAGGTGFDGGVRIVLDLGGDDVYESEGPGSLAAGAGGVGVLLDAGGDDTYRARRAGLGVGLIGVGLLLDLAGDDVYDGESLGQGAGYFGLGMLLDASGNDLYRLGAYGQGYASVGGVGLLRDYGGGDRYVAAPAFTDVIRYEDHHISFLQGAAFGSRPDRSGGVGLLVDDAGNDTYQSDIFGQGVAYWFALGALIDRGGHDVYAGYQYSHGAGVHLAVGLLLDESGEDLYSARGVSQGCGHDLAAGLLVDRSGNDSYVSVDLSQGAGSANGFGVLYDVAGEDAYVVRRTDNSQGYGNPRRGTGSIGLLLDGKGSDVFADRGRDGTTWWGSRMGAGFDDPAEMTREEAWPQDPPEPADSLDLDDDDLFILATTGPPRFREMRDAARTRLAERGAEAMPALLPYMSSRIPRERHGLKDIFVEMGEVTVPFLATVLDTGSARARRQAAWSLGYVGSADALPHLEKLLAAEEPSLRTEGAFAIAVIAREDTVAAASVPVGSLARALDDEDPNVRRAATFALGALRREEARASLLAALDDDYFTVRLSAVDGLVRLGAGSRAALLSRAATRGGTGRIFALMALERLVREQALVLDVSSLGEHSAWTSSERLALAKLCAATLESSDGTPDAALRRCLVALREDDAWEVRSVATRALETGP